MKTIITIIMVFMASMAIAGNWNDSPSNWQNNQSNWDNSSSNWKNSPSNWQNNPSNLNSNRIIRDNEGNATGYAVPKSDGRINIYDLKGNRKGYVPK